MLPLAPFDDVAAPFVSSNTSCDNEHKYKEVFIATVNYIFIGAITLFSRSSGVVHLPN